MMKQRDLNALGAFDKEKDALNVIIETPKDSRNKFTYDEERGMFKLGGVLPIGASFPFDFGFVPSTLGGDGDPLDVLLLMDAPAFSGCFVHARLIGVVEAEQTEEGKTEKNDRLIAVAVESRNHRDVTSIEQLAGNLIEEIEHFFVSYNEAKGKKFKVVGRNDAGRAKEIVEEGARRFRNEQKKKRTSKK